MQWCVKTKFNMVHSLNFNRYFLLLPKIYSIPFPCPLGRVSIEQNFKIYWMKIFTHSVGRGHQHFFIDSLDSQVKTLANIVRCTQKLTNEIREKKKTVSQYTENWNGSRISYEKIIHKLNLNEFISIFNFSSDTREFIEFMMFSIAPPANKTDDRRSVISNK